MILLILCSPLRKNMFQSCLLSIVLTVMLSSKDKCFYYCAKGARGQKTHQSNWELIRTRRHLLHTSHQHCETSFTLSLVEKCVALFGNSGTAEPLLWGMWPNIYHLEAASVLGAAGDPWVLCNPHGCALGPFKLLWRDELSPRRLLHPPRWSYSALGIILQGLVIGTLPGMKWHSPEFGAQPCIMNGGRESGTDWGVISVPPQPPRGEDFECSQCFLLQFTCQGDSVADVWNTLVALKFEC